jgi:membrane protein DedA with SNARE-associated domain/membrane-associated phospholipid phosphatase
MDAALRFYRLGSASMTSFFAGIVDLVSAHPHFAYAAVFLLALSEAMPVVGTVVPGSTLILGISALAPRGIVELWPLLVAAILGAIVGDALSFWLGHRYHQAVLLRWPLNRYPQLVAHSETFFRRYGSFSVFLARFTPAVRAFVPLIAGIFQMRTVRFYVANVLSALVWAPLHVFPGVLVGALFSMTGAAAGRLAVLSIAVVIAIWVTVLAVRLFLRLGIPRFVAGQTRLWAWTTSADNRVTSPLRALLDPTRNEAKTLVPLALGLAAAAWIVFSILEVGELLVRTDTSVYHVFQSLRTYWGDALMLAIAELGDASVTIPVAVIVLLWLSWRRAWGIGLYWIGAVGFAMILDAVIKLTLYRNRSTDGLYLGGSEYSAIAGHSTVNAVMYVFLSFLIARRLPPPGRLRVSLAATAFVVLIGLSRLYLGAHWFSEVTGGFVFGMTWIALLSVAYLNHQSVRPQSRGLLVVACGCLVLAGGLNIYRSHAKDVQRYGVRPEVPTMTASDWWVKDWRQLPTRRVDIKGTMEEPLTIQWAGDLQRLKDALLQRDWRLPEPWTAASAIAWLSGNTDPLTLPVIPYLDSGRAPSLLMIHLRDVSAALKPRLVLRLWASDFELRNGVSQPLWSGSVVEEHFGRFLGLFTVVSADPDANSPREALAADIDSEHLVARRVKQPATTWDGNILLIHDAEVEVK